MRFCELGIVSVPEHGLARRLRRVELAGEEELHRPSLCGARQIARHLETLGEVRGPLGMTSRRREVARGERQPAAGRRRKHLELGAPAALGCPIEAFGECQPTLDRQMFAETDDRLVEHPRSGFRVVVVEEVDRDKELPVHLVVVAAAQRDAGEGGCGLRAGVCSRVWRRGQAERRGREQAGVDRDRLTVVDLAGARHGSNGVEKLCGRADLHGQHQRAPAEHAPQRDVAAASRGFARRREERKLVCRRMRSARPGECVEPRDVDAGCRCMGVLAGRLLSCPVCELDRRSWVAVARCEDVVAKDLVERLAGVLGVADASDKSVCDTAVSHRPCAGAERVSQLGADEVVAEDESAAVVRQQADVRCGVEPVCHFAGGEVEHLREQRCIDRRAEKGCGGQHVARRGLELSEA